MNMGFYFLYCQINETLEINNCKLKNEWELASCRIIAGIENESRVPSLILRT